jgi:hypothetical protein
MITIIRGTDLPPKQVYAIIKANAAKIEIKPSSYTNNYNALAGGRSYPIETANSHIDSLIISFENFIMAEKDTF